MNNDKFKVTFMLDYRAMLTVHTDKYGVGSILFVLVGALGAGHISAMFLPLGHKRHWVFSLYIPVSF